jgi:dolichol-phosphate mannosyltransferase
MQISVVIPVYKSSNTIKILTDKLKEILGQITEDYEIVFVDDFCPQNSWLNIVSEANIDKRIKGLKLLKNSGQHHAISVGLCNAVGEWVVIMDCDLQDNPAEIINMLDYAKIKNSKIVFAKRFNRKDFFFKKITSKIFHKILSYLTDVNFDSSVANYGVFHKDVVRQYNNLIERVKYFPIVIKTFGYQIEYINVDHNSRIDGKSSYNFTKRLNLAIDIILSFSNKPLLLIVKIGFFISISSFLFAVITILRYFNGSIQVSGYTSILVSIWFLSGLVIMMIGISGLYLGRVFDEVKKRPINCVNDKINL